MKTLIAIVAAATVFSASAIAGEGGKLWEKKAELQESIINMHLHEATAAGMMDHTAVEHKRWLVDDVTAGYIKQKQMHKAHSTAPHKDHMAVDHKRALFGSDH